MALDMCFDIIIVSMYQIPFTFSSAIQMILLDSLIESVIFAIPSSKLPTTSETKLSTDLILTWHLVRKTKLKKDP